MVLTWFLNSLKYVEIGFLQMTPTEKPYSADDIKALAHSRMFHNPGACCAFIQTGAHLHRYRAPLSAGRCKNSF